MSKELKITEEAVKKLYNETKCPTVKATLETLFGDSVKNFKRALENLSNNAELSTIRLALEKSLNHNRGLYLCIRTTGNRAYQGLFIGSGDKPTMTIIKDDEGAWVLVPDEN